jgi:hypothetical protein
MGEGNRGASSAALAGMLWFTGWLFTIMFCQLAFWKILVGIMVWPLFLGEAVRKIVIGA